jgi:hypothetical protein
MGNEFRALFYYFIGKDTATSFQRTRYIVGTVYVMKGYIEHQVYHFSLAHNQTANTEI